MDIISFNEASTANGRIEKFIENPDSTSGIVTVPKVIGAGENITIPAGRVAVLPNVQVDGTLNIEGEVFIPSGATMSKVVEKVTSTDNAIVRFNGTTGDVQNSGVIIDDSGNVGVGTSSPSSSLTIKDGLTLISQFGNSTPRPALTSGVQKYGVHVGTDSADDGFLRLSAGGGTNSYAKSYIDISGYSTVSDMNMNIVFGCAGAERVRIGASGNVMIGTTTDNGVDKLQVNGSISATNTVSSTQFKRNTNSPGGMTGYFGDKIEYALRNAIGTTSKTFRVTCSSPTNNENFGVFVKTKQVQYNVNPCVGIFDWMCGFKQPGSGATVTLLHTTTCASYGMANQISINVVAVNSSSFDMTISTATNYLNAVLELEAIFTSGTCTIIPL